jgi:hypothetical protein
VREDVETGLLLKIDIPLEFCFHCSRFNRRTKNCIATDNGPYVCIWSMRTAMQWAEDMVTAGTFKANPLKKAG